MFVFFYAYCEPFAYCSNIFRGRFMTEDEAKTKWCPFVRFTTPYAAKAVDFIATSVDEHWSNRIDDSRCIASDCMAWRWLNNKRTEFDEHGNSFTTSVDPIHGYCGLAGKS